MIEWINLITPLIVFGVTWLVKKYLPMIAGWGIIGFVVPILGAILSWVMTLITPETAWLTQFLISLLAVFINELIKQLTPKTP